MVGLVQMSMGKDASANVDKALRLIRTAARRGAQIICLPELFNSPYVAQSEDASCFRYAETIPGPTSRALAQAARAKKVVIVAPLFERRAEGLYHNSAAVIDADGKLLGVYRKMHVPEDPLFNEKFYFAPGDLGFKTFKTRFARIGVLICWDQWFPEAARLIALQGAQILFYPTAIGGHPDDSPKEWDAQRSAWRVVQRGHAVANELFVAAANRVGREGKIRFWGSSFVTGPFGEVAAELDKAREGILTVSCDLSRIEATRHGWPFLRDRRIDAYEAISSRFIDPD